MVYLRPSFLTVLLALLFAGCHLLPSAFGQSTTATLSGTVVDQNGAVVPTVAITITNLATRQKREATTNEDGNFTVPLLPPATYTVNAQRDGFAPVELRNVVLNVGDQKALHIQLKTGDVNATVEVTDQSPLINESPAVATTVNRQFVENLPLNGRSLQSLILLSPGIVSTPVSTSSAGEFSVNGQRSNANYFTIDGVGANVAITNFPTSDGTTSNALAGMLPGLNASGSSGGLVSIDGLEEFKIQTSTYSAQYGRQPGGQVQLVTRSGTSDLHGTLFEYIRNEAFDARNWFNTKPNPEPPTRQNQFGGTLSGPIFLPKFGEGGPRWYNGRHRTFFFFSYEGQRLRLPVTAVFAVPSLRLRQIAPPALQPVLNAFPLPTGPEVLANLDNNPATPLTPSGGAPFVAAYSNPKSQDATSIRVDHNFSNNHSVFGRYNEAPSTSLSRNLAQLFGSVFDTRTLTLGAASLVTKNFSNEFRFNYSQNRAQGSGWLDNFGGAVPIDLSLLLPGYTGELKNVQGRFSFGTVAGSGELFIGDNSNSHQTQFNFVDNIYWKKGNHQLRAGVDYRRLAPTYGPLSYRQTARANILSVQQEANFLNGVIGSLSIDGQGTAVRPRFSNFSAYVQDTWQAQPRLVLDFGVRWELNPAPTEADGRKPVFVAGAENLSTARLTRPDDPWYKTFYTAFAPRFGTAYRLNQTGGRETVIRGGFGVYYDLNSGRAAAAFSGFPFNVQRTVCCSNAIQWPITPAQATLPPPANVTLPVPDTLDAVNENLKLPYTLQWNVAIEQAFGNLQSLTVSYVASAARQLTTTQRLNQPLPSTSIRPNPNFQDINFITNGPTSSYHSMQAQYQRRFHQGLQAIINYTWSHAIDEVSNEVEQGTLIRGNASFDVRHNFSSGLTYDVPRLRRVPLFDAILRDWSIDSVILTHSGTPLDITVAGGSEVFDDGTFAVVRPDVVSGVPFWIDDSNVPGGRKINVAAFALPPRIPGSSLFARAGTLGRNVVRGPGIFQVNLALRRKFRLTEKVDLQLKGEAFNLFNTPMFGIFITRFSPGNTFFGRAVATLNNQSSGGPGGSLNSLYQLGGPRSMQFSMKLSF